MGKKIYLSPSSQNENAYATGGTTEQTECREISEACAVFLRKNGFSVKNADYGTMHTRVAESDKWGADLHVAIHTNATAKHNVTGGTQVYLYKLNGEHKKVGQAVLDRLAPITPGKSAEGLKQNSSFYEIKEANAITVYVECEFHDTKEGSDFIRTHTTEIGEAIAKGICDYYGVKVPETSKKEDTKTDDTLYCVQLGAFSKYENAQKMLDSVKAKGFNDAIITVKKK